MVIELSWRWPFVRKHICEVRQASVAADTPPHMTWVNTDQGRGWLHHHESDGYVIQLESGKLIKRTPDQFEHLT